MIRFLREYGILVVAIAVAMAGFVYYTNHKEDVLAYTLDVLGERLMEMVDDADTKDVIAKRFADIRNRILDKQVDPADVEILAANVLNLSASGTKLTANEAELMLDLDMWPEGSSEIDDQTLVDIEFLIRPEPPVPAVPIKMDEERFDELGAKLDQILRTESELWAMAEGVVVQAPSEPFMVFSADDGLHVAVDSMILARIDVKKRWTGKTDGTREKALVERRDLMVDRKAARAKAWTDMERMRENEKEIVESRRGYVHALRVVKGLEAKGVNYFVDSDSIAAIIEVGIREAKAMMNEQARVQEALTAAEAKASVSVKVGGSQRN